MTNIVYGMNFALQGGNAITAPTYTTNQSRLQIDLNNPAPLFDVVTVSAGTAFSVDLSQVQTDTEQLLVVDHNLGYVPQVYVILSLTSINTPGAYSSFSFGFALLAEGGAGDDFINYSINSSTLTINHTVESNGTGSGSYTSTAPNYSLRIKYLICNNPAIQTISIN